MGTVGVVIVTAGLLAAAPFAQTANVSGIWELEMFWPEAKSTGQCVFQQEGDNLNGTCGGGADKFPVTGRVDGNRVSWQLDVKQDGSSNRMEFSGEVDGQGTTIRGSCSVVGLNSGKFTMTRSR